VIRRLGLASLAVCLLAAGGAGGTAANADGAAGDGPGALSHFDLARKDCLGTARNRSSKVWYTVANGVLSDVYYPTIDNTNVEKLEYAVTDGSTFTDLQTRDMRYSVDVDAGGMQCTVTATAKSGRYRIVTDYVTDPARNAVVMRVRFDNLRKGPLSLYVLFDPTVNGNGGGGSGNGGADSATVDTSRGHPILVASDPVTTTNAVNRDYAQPVAAALDGPFTTATSGFAGAASDGRVQLDTAHTLTSTFTSANGGNVVQAARVDAREAKQFTLTLGSGRRRARRSASRRRRSARRSRSRRSRTRSAGSSTTCSSYGRRASTASTTRTTRTRTC
jgi:hypothetical protein